MRAVIGDRVIRHIVGGDPLQHAPDVLGTIAELEQPPLGERDRLVVLRREIGVRLQAVRLGDELVEVVARRLVVVVHADDVDHVVARVALRPRDRVMAAVGREVEAEVLPLHRAHRGDDASPVGLPRGGVGPAPAGVGGAVHLPAEHDDRLAQARGHQPGGEQVEGLVEPAPHALGQEPRHDVVGQVALVRYDHRHVQRQLAPRPGGDPSGPGLQDEVRPGDGLPAVAGQVRTADLHLAAQPGLELRQAGRTTIIRSQEDAHGCGAVVLGHAVEPRRGHQTPNPYGDRTHGHKPVNYWLSNSHRVSPHVAGVFAGDLECPSILYSNIYDSTATISKSRSYSASCTVLRHFMVYNRISRHRMLTIRHQVSPPPAERTGRVS